MVALTAVANHVRLVRLNHVDQFILSYGGLRGAIAFALASLLDRQQFRNTRDLFITTTIAIIYFTNFVMVSPLRRASHALRLVTKKKVGYRKQIARQQTV